MGNYTLEDVTSPIFVSLTHAQQISICMKTKPALITKQYKMPFNPLSNPLITGDMHNDVNRSLVWGIYKCNLASSKWFGLNSISWHSLSQISSDLWCGHCAVCHYCSYNALTLLSHSKSSLGVVGIFTWKLLPILKHY